VKKHALSCVVVLLLASPVLATITKQQSAALWNQTSTTTCAQPFGNNTGAHNLIVVWTSWQSTSTFTASVNDSFPTQDIFASAVGPTQSASSTPTTAQIFYAPNINGGSDTVTVTYSGTGTVSSASCVIVEYSGADENYPLDSVSVGHSTSGNPTTFLDSGAAAPANSNLLVFAGGVADQNISMVAGGGFTSLQASNGTWGTGIVESSTAAISGNNVLQRATACIGTTLPCPSGGTSTGDWLMQMAIFRDASWTVGGGWNPARPAQIQFADQFPGADACAKITAAWSALGSTAGTVAARGITGNQECSAANANALISSSAQGRLGGWPRPGVHLTLEGAPSKLRLGGDFRDELAETGAHGTFPAFCPERLWGWRFCLPPFRTERGRMGHPMFLVDQKESTTVAHSSLFWLEWAVSDKQVPPLAS